MMGAERRQTECRRTTEQQLSHRMSPATLVAGWAATDERRILVGVSFVSLPSETLRLSSYNARRPDSRPAARRQYGILTVRCRPARHRRFGVVMPFCPTT